MEEAHREAAGCGFQALACGSLSGTRQCHWNDITESSTRAEWVATRSWAEGRNCQRTGPHFVRTLHFGSVR
jgi:hypothetical protein